MVREKLSQYSGYALRVISCILRQRNPPLSQQNFYFVDFSFFVFGRPCGAAWWPWWWASPPRPCPAGAGSGASACPVLFTRTSKTEYISCPGCGRTLYDLEKTIARIKAATSHLKGLKIGIMGCIVNGPGEMADADYGYVGAGRGKISLYKGKVCVEKNIPEEEAVERLLEFIRTDREENQQ